MRAQADRAALRPLPGNPYLVADAHLRRIGKDCLVSFEASLYSVPARRVRAGQRVELRVTGEQVVISPLPGQGDGGSGDGPLAVHRRATQRGSWVVDRADWDGLPDGTGRSTTVAGDLPAPRTSSAVTEADPLAGCSPATAPPASCSTGGHWPATRRPPACRPAR